ncbi:MAG: TatD family hydrolase [Clostridia bacterium]|nr:TatD family hydrolase [Clostridia bacterium]
MRFFDTHAHYWDSRFVTESEESAESLIGSLLSDSVSGIVNIGTNLRTSRLALTQATLFPGVYVAAGLHPEDVLGSDDPEKEITEIRDLIKNNPMKIVAIGEIGLDYHYSPLDKDLQKRVFIRQMELAEALSLPVVIHDREAHGDTFGIISAFPKVKGVLHSYSGSGEMARQLAKMGYMISFSGTVSFKNARSVKEAAAATPDDNLLLETDCPYLAPHPFRGQLNHSGLLIHTARALAEIRNCPVEDIAALTERNARHFFRLPE